MMCRWAAGVEKAENWDVQRYEREGLVVVREMRPMVVASVEE